MENKKDNSFYINIITCLTMITINYFLKIYYIPTQNHLKKTSLISLAKTILVSTIENIPGPCSWTNEVEEILGYFETTLSIYSLSIDSNSITYIEQLEKINAAEALFDQSCSFLEELHRFTSVNHIAVMNNELLLETISSFNNNIGFLILTTSDQNNLNNLDLLNLKQIIESTNHLLRMVPFNIDELD